jgi:hypothetical protein
MKFWRLFFAFAALNNLAIGGFMLAAADSIAPRLGVSGPAAGYIVGFAGLIIAIFGVAYAIVAYRPLPNRNIVVVGALGKASTVAFTSWHALAGHIPLSTFQVSLGDLFFALMFAVFVAQTRGHRLQP